MNETNASDALAFLKDLHRRRALYLGEEDAPLMRLHAFISGVLLGASMARHDQEHFCKIVEDYHAFIIHRLAEGRGGAAPFVKLLALKGDELAAFDHYFSFLDEFARDWDPGKLVG